MKNLFFSLLLITSFPSVYSQHPKSYFYNEKGQFLLDTTLVISKLQLEKWILSEINIAADLSMMEYPKIYLDNYIKPPDHPIIVSFELDTSEISNIKILSDSSLFDNSVVKGLIEQGKTIAKRINRWNHSKQNYREVYYLAFKFDTIDLEERMRLYKAVPVIRNSGLPFITIID